MDKGEFYFPAYIPLRIEELHSPEMENDLQPTLPPYEKEHQCVPVSTEGLSPFVGFYPEVPQTSNSELNSELVVLDTPDRNAESNENAVSSQPQLNFDIESTEEKLERYGSDSNLVVLDTPDRNAESNEYVVSSQPKLNFDTETTEETLERYANDPEEIVRDILRIYFPYYYPMPPKSQRR